MKKNFVSKIGIPVLAICVALLMAACPCLDGVQLVPDAALRHAIQVELQKPLGCLTEADLQSVHSLYAQGVGINSIDGLEYCVNLTELDLSDNNIADIGPLNSLSNQSTGYPLHYLDLSGNIVENIQPLAGLLGLDYLDLSGNVIAEWDDLTANVTNGGFDEGGTVIADVSVEFGDGSLNPSFEVTLNALLLKNVNVLIGEVIVTSSDAS